MGKPDGRSAREVLVGLVADLNNARQYAESKVREAEVALSIARASHLAACDAWDAARCALGTLPKEAPDAR